MDSLLAGSVAGIVADLITHPIGTIKTRLQVQGASKGASLAQYSGIRGAATSILRTEGAGTLYRGIGIVVATAAPAQGLFFVGNDFARDALEPYVPPAAANFAAGFFAQLCGSMLWVPMDTVKERLQIEGQLKTLKGDAALGSSFGAVKKIIAREGFKGFFPAYWIHQWTWAPFNGLYFSIYEACKAYTDAASMPAWPCGIVAGVIAGAATNPADLVKTRLQVARAAPETFQYAGAIDCARTIVRKEGLRALFDGTTARCLTVTPRLTIVVVVKDALMPYVSTSLS